MAITDPTTGKSHFGAAIEVLQDARLPLHIGPFQHGPVPGGGGREARHRTPKAPGATHAATLVGRPPRIREPPGSLRTTALRPSQVVAPYYAKSLTMSAGTTVCTKRGDLVKKNQYDGLVVTKWQLAPRRRYKARLGGPTAC
jgi:hypothetical protein